MHAPMTISDRSADYQTSVSEREKLGKRPELARDYTVMGYVMMMLQQNETWQKDEGKERKSRRGEGEVAQSTSSKGDIKSTDR